MKLLEVFVTHKRATLLFLLMVMLYGYVAYTKIPKERNPDIKIPIIYTYIRQDGISPEDAERLLVQPVENAYSSINGVKHITSYASEGSASIILEFVAGIDNAKALTDVRSKADDVQNKLPRDARKPDIHQVDLSLVPILNVIVTGEVPQRAMIASAQELQGKIEGISDVMEVTINGDAIDVAELLISPSKLEFYGVHLAAIQNAVSSNNQLVTIGKIRNKNGQYSVKIPNLVKDPRELLKFPLYISSPEKEVVSISDVAELRIGYKDPTSIARVNGKAAVILNVSKRSGANIIEVVEKIKNVVAEQMKAWPENLEVIYANDQSAHILDTVADLENGIILAAIFVVITIILSVGIKASVLVLLSLPASFFATILILKLTGLTLNIVVLFSLILTVGMVVDDAIVVSEYADRKMVEGHSAKQAFLEAASRMFWPIISATSVRMAVFVPLLFWPGIIGQFMKFMPITVVIIMSASLIFALFFQPAIGTLFFSKQKQASPEQIAAMLAAEGGELHNLKGITRTYAELVSKLLNKPKLTVAVIMGSIALIYIAFFKLGHGIEFFPDIEPESATVVLRAPGNLSVQQASEIMKEAEAEIAKFAEEIRVYHAVSGDIGHAGASLPGDYIGTINLEFGDWQKRRKAAVILSDISKALSHIEGIAVMTLIQQSGPKAAKPIEVDIWSDEYPKTIAFIPKLRKFLEDTGGFKDVEDSSPVPGIEWHLNFDRKLGAKYGITAADAGSIIQLLTDGFKISSYRTANAADEVDIMLRFPPEHRNISQLDHLKIVNNRGAVVPLSSFIAKKPSPLVNTIKHSDQHTVITVKSDVMPGYTVDGELKKLRAWLDTQKQESSIKLDYQVKGDDESQKESADFLKNAFAAAILAMFIIMLIQFNSFYHAIVVMSAVFLATAGVLLGLLLSGQAFGIVMCGLGIIALAGIVLNNNILFVDTYQKLRAANISIHEAAVMAGVQRMRPILLTAATAVLGLIPLVLGVTIDLIQRAVTYDAPSSQWWRQLSAAIAGGLSFATVLTLFCTPCLLVLGARFEKDQLNKQIN